MFANKSINIRSINNTDLPIILYKPDRNVLQIIDKWWSNCKNMLILQLVYPRVGQHFWDGPEMVANIFILQHSDQAKKACTNLTYLGYILDNNVCQHVGIVCPLLQSFLGSVRWSFSILLAALLFYNTWKTGAINCFIVVYWEIEIYITPTFARI